MKKRKKERFEHVETYVSAQYPHPFPTPQLQPLVLHFYSNDTPAVASTCVPSIQHRFPLFEALVLCDPVTERNPIVPGEQEVEGMSFCETWFVGDVL
jgi:hypothetical protein